LGQEIPEQIYLFRTNSREIGNAECVFLPGAVPVAKDYIFPFGFILQLCHGSFI
jgi:hypothetical protein